jgi:5'-3' exonuclease
MTQSKVNDWQAGQIKEFRDGLLACHDIPSLVSLARNLIYFSQQAWFLKGCNPAYLKRLNDLRDGKPARVILLVDLKAIAHLAYSRARTTDPAQEFATIVNAMKAKFRDPGLILYVDENETGGWRYAADPRWKEKRQEPEKGFLGFMERLREALDKRQAKRYLIEGYEADDVIASLASSYALAGDKCVGICQDKDMYQILSPQFNMYWKGEFFNRDSLTKRYSVEPSMWVDWLSLVGRNDIPGAAGIGEVGASKLLITFGSYMNCLNAIDQVKLQFTEKIAESLLAFEPHYFNTTRMHRLNRTLDVEVLV